MSREKAQPSWWRLCASVSREGSGGQGRVRWPLRGLNKYFQATVCMNEETVGSDWVPSASGLPRPISGVPGERSAVSLGRSVSRAHGARCPAAVAWPESGFRMSSVCRNGGRTRHGSRRGRGGRFVLGPGGGGRSGYRRRGLCPGLQGRGGKVSSVRETRERRAWAEAHVVT